MPTSLHELIAIEPGRALHTYLRDPDAFEQVVALLRSRIARIPAQRHKELQNDPASVDLLILVACHFFAVQATRYCWEELFSELGLAAPYTSLYQALERSLTETFGRPVLRAADGRRRFLATFIVESGFPKRFDFVVELVRKAVHRFGWSETWPLDMLQAFLTEHRTAIPDFVAALLEEQEFAVAFQRLMLELTTLHTLVREARLTTLHEVQTKDHPLLRQALDAVPLDLERTLELLATLILPARGDAPARLGHLQVEGYDRALSAARLSFLVDPIALQDLPASKNDALTVTLSCGDWRDRAQLHLRRDASGALQASRPSHALPVQGWTEPIAIEVELDGEHAVLAPSELSFHEGAAWLLFSRHPRKNPEWRLTTSTVLERARDHLLWLRGDTTVESHTPTLVPLRGGEGMRCYLLEAGQEHELVLASYDHTCHVLSSWDRPLVQYEATGEVFANSGILTSSPRLTLPNRHEGLSVRLRHGQEVVQLDPILPGNHNGLQVLRRGPWWDLTCDTSLDGPLQLEVYIDRHLAFRRRFLLLPAETVFRRVFPASGTPWCTLHHPCLRQIVARGNPGLKITVEASTHTHHLERIVGYDLENVPVTLHLESTAWRCQKTVMLCNHNAHAGIDLSMVEGAAPPMLQGDTYQLSRRRFETEVLLLQGRADPGTAFQFRLSAPDDRLLLEGKIGASGRLRLSRQEIIARLQRRASHRLGSSDLRLTLTLGALSRQLHLVDRLVRKPNPCYRDRRITFEVDDDAPLSSEDVSLLCYAYHQPDCPPWPLALTTLERTGQHYVGLSEPIDLTPGKYFVQPRRGTEILSWGGPLVVPPVKAPEPDDPLVSILLTLPEIRPEVFSSWCKGLLTNQTTGTRFEGIFTSLTMLGLHYQLLPDLLAMYAPWIFLPSRCPELAIVTGLATWPRATLVGLQDITLLDPLLLDAETLERFAYHVAADPHRLASLISAVSFTVSTVPELKGGSTNLSVVLTCLAAIFEHLGLPALAALALGRRCETSAAWQAAKQRLLGDFDPLAELREERAMRDLLERCGARDTNLSPRWDELRTRLRLVQAHDGMSILPQTELSVRCRELVNLLDLPNTSPSLPGKSEVVTLRRAWERYRATWSSMLCAAIDAELDLLEVLLPVTWHRCSLQRLEQPGTWAKILSLSKSYPALVDYWSHYLLRVVLDATPRTGTSHSPTSPQDATRAGDR